MLDPLALRGEARAAIEAIHGTVEGDVSRAKIGRHGICVIEHVE